MQLSYYLRSSETNAFCKKLCFSSYSLVVIWKQKVLTFHQIKACYTFILKVVSFGHCYQGQINYSQEMHSYKTKWNCILLLPWLICTLHLNIQYDGMSLNCEAGINEVTWFIPSFFMAFIDLTDFKNYTLNNILNER